MSEQLPATEMRPAHEWTCECCGSLNYCSGIAFEGSPEDLAEMKDAFGVEPYEDGEFLMMPETVECSSCSSKYRTIEYGQEDNDNA